MPLPVLYPVCASTTKYSEEEVREHKYFLKCEPCDVKWKSPVTAEECWSCGQMRFQWH